MHHLHALREILFADLAEYQSQHDPGMEYPVRGNRKPIMPAPNITITSRTRPRLI